MLQSTLFDNTSVLIFQFENPSSPGWMKLLVPAELILFLDPDTSNFADNISKTLEQFEQSAEKALDTAFNKAQEVVTGF